LSADTFVAIDFETATSSRDSACSVALVRVEGGKVVASKATLIRPPPDKRWEFQHVHGIAREDVENERPFFRVWPELAPMLEGAAFLVAHNASFDRSVLRACCALDHLRMPALPWVCTVAMAKAAWGHASNKLNLVCERLGIPLRHHEALSDALACAQVYLRALEAGVPTTFLGAKDEGYSPRAAASAAPAPAAVPAPAPVGQLTLDGSIAPAPKAARPRPVAAPARPAPSAPPAAPPPAPSVPPPPPSGKRAVSSEVPRPVPAELDARGWWDFGREVAQGRAVRPEFDDAFAEGVFFGGFCSVRHEREMARIAVLLELTRDELRALLTAPAPAKRNDETTPADVAPVACGVCKVGALIEGRMCLRCGWQREETAA
jgi:DNA polymerase III subunit epsilon